MTLFLAFLSVSMLLGSDISPDTLQNSHLRAVISPATAGVRAGSLLELTDLATGVDLADGHQFGGIQSGAYIPFEGEIQHLSDTCAVFHSPYLFDHSASEVLPVSVEIEWTLVGRGLEAEIRLTTTGECDIQEPLEIDFYVGEYDQAVFGNQTTSDDRVLDIQAWPDVIRLSADQFVRLEESASMPGQTFVFPNPAKNMLAINRGNEQDNYLTMRFFDVESPRENCMGPDLRSVLPEGDVSSYFVRVFVGEAPAFAYFSGHPDGYERTASWIMDEIPFIHPDQGDLWGYSTTSSGDEVVTAQMIQLLEEHPDMKMNWLVLPDAILTPNRDSVWFEPGMEDSWSHWHCTWRISTLAPPDFIQWILNIQDNVYPWADRVSLGCHGYHHTPNADSSFGEFHEFITYEPDEHMERFSMVESDYTDIGMDLSMMRVIRYSGHRTSLSGLWATIAHDFDFYCNGIRWWDHVAGEPFLDQQITKFQTPQGRIWGSNTVWWGDWWSQQPDEYLSTVLERGKHCLLGAHPINMLAPAVWPEPYLRIDSICTSMEEDYPYFGWLLPIEYGDFLEECYQCRVTGIRTGPGYLAFHFTGSTSEGQTLVAQLPEGATVQNVLVNGSPVFWEHRDGDRIFISIDDLAPWDHVAEVWWYDVGIEEGTPERPDDIALDAFPSPFNTTLSVNYLLTSPGRIDLSVYDISGRRVGTLATGHMDAGENSSTWDPGDLPSGCYVVLLRTEGDTMTADCILIR